MKKVFFKMVFVTTLMTQVFASDDDALEQSIAAQYGIEGLPSALVFKLIENDIHADVLRQFHNAEDVRAVFSDSGLSQHDLAVISSVLFAHPEAAAPAALSVRPEGTRSVRHAAPELPESLAEKLKQAGIILGALEAIGPDNITAALGDHFSSSDIAHIKHVLFGIPLPAQYAVANAARELVVIKMLSARRHPKVSDMRQVVASVLTQINTFGDVHQHDDFCAANIDALLQVANDMGFGKADYKEEAAAEAEGPKRSEVYQVLFRFMSHFPDDSVQAQHGFSAEAGERWIAGAVMQAANRPKVLSLVAYTISILDELKALDGDTTFGTLKYLVLQQIMENYKENGGCLEGVRNRAMKSLAMMLNFILNS
ncbi:MAG TPA: hypothetical protein DIC42_01030 [Holosporales bacterium]|nr:hypothetical protein [Holosporales bacterium]